MKWFKNNPTKGGLYWAKLPGHTEAQVVMVTKTKFKALKFQVIGDTEYFNLESAIAWCSKRPMKPSVK